MSMSKVHCEKLLERAHLMGMDAGRRVGVTPMLVLDENENPVPLINLQGKFRPEMGLSLGTQVEKCSS